MTPEAPLSPDIESLNIRKSGFVLIPEKAALLVIDMQRFFLDESSHAFIERGVPIIPNINRLIREFKKNRSRVILTQHAHPAGSDPGSMGRWWRDVMWEDSPLTGIDERVQRDPEDTVILKHKYDAFMDTQLEPILNRGKIRQIVISGVMSDLCCETTARTAFCRDFDVVFVWDATATTTIQLHQSALRTLAHGFAVLMSTDELVGMMSNTRSEG